MASTPRIKTLLRLVACILTTHLVDRALLLAPANCISTPAAAETIVHIIRPKESAASLAVVAPNKTMEPTQPPTQSAQGGIFYCGYTDARMGNALFPDYAQRYEGGLDSESHKGFQEPRRAPTTEDVLIFGMHGPCRAKLEDFPGKVLVTNGEPEGGDITKRTRLKGKELSQDIYQIGSVPDDGKNTILAYFFVFAPFLNNYFANGEKNLLQNLYDHQHKPINTGKYNAMIYTNSKCHHHREDAVNEISTVLPIHIGGKCKGARPHKGNYTSMPTPREWTRNYEVQQNYKFCFAMENSFPYQPHYITEKILNPFLAGCIPIYYGTPDVFDVFNKEAMVYYDPSDPAPALKRLTELYRNETFYNETLYHQPILANGNETLRKYFSLVDDIEGGYLKQKIRTVMGV